MDSSLAREFVLRNVPKHHHASLLYCASNVRGTAGFWGKRRRELESILREKGYPTIFMISISKINQRVCAVSQKGKLIETMLRL
jgi:hypothetical protein